MALEYVGRLVSSDKQNSALYTYRITEFKMFLDSKKCFNKNVID